MPHTYRTNPRTRLRKRRPSTVAALLVALVLAVTSCSSNKAEEDAKAPESTAPKTLSIPPECRDELGVGGEDGEAVDAAALSPRCRDAIFLTAVTANGSEELKAADDDQQLAFGHGICAYAATISDNLSAAPSYKELVESTSTSWDMPKHVVEEVIVYANELCPDEIGILQEMKKNVGSVDVHMAVSGETPLDITYTGPNGDAIETTIDEIPWEHMLSLQAPADVEFTASSDSGDVTCSVVVEDHEIKRNTEENGKQADCSVTAAEVRDAAG